MTDDDEALRREMVATCRAMNASGINQGTAGNVSVRNTRGFLVTPSSLSYDAMEPGNIVQMYFDGTYDGVRRPSSEWRFHRDIHQARPDIGAIVHCHSVYATTLAVHHREIPSFHYMTGLFGGATIRCAPYATFGTQALSDAALEALEGRLGCLLGQHGQISLGRTLAQALANAVELETLSRVYVQALTLGEPPVLDDAEMARVIAQMRSMRYGNESAEGATGGRAQQAPASARVLDLDALADELAAGQGPARRLVAVAGAPGSGKSSLAEALVTALAGRVPAAVLPMDGFHFDDMVLDARAHRPRKGAPHTFDVDGLASVLGRLAADDGREVAVPVFDRAIEIARAGARIIGPDVRLVVVEGNYLLLDDPAWAPLRRHFDLTVFLEVPEAVLEERLRARWVGYGLDALAIRAKLEDNDLPNARRVARSSVPADVVVRNVGGPAS